MTDTTTYRRRLLGALLGTGLLGGAIPCTRAAGQPATQPANGRRFALVIGNARYAIPANALINPANDAKLVTESLRRRGFDTTVLTDLTTTQMETAVDEFAARASGADMAMVYFAGHAVALDDINYLFGVELGVPLSDVRINNAQRNSLSIKRVSLALQRAKIRARLLVLDACRTALTRGQPLAGLTRAVPAGGELIAFSTQPGATAEDGFGRDGPRHSPYAFYFAQALDTLPASVPVETFFKQLTGDVQIATAYRQIPHYASSLVGTVTLASLVDGQSPAVPGASVSSNAGQAGRGPAPTLGRDLIKERMSAWEYEIEHGAEYLDTPRLESLRARAKAVDVVAMTTLGLVLENGKHVKMDAREAAVWYRRAADRNFAPAQTYLGEMAAVGKGIPKDFTLADRLLRAAADAGHRRAALDLIDLKARMGEPIDPNELIKAMKDAMNGPGGPQLPGMRNLPGMPALPGLPRAPAP